MMTLLQINISILLFYGLWAIFLRRTRTHQIQRFFLLFGLFISVAIPFLPQFDWVPQMLPKLGPQISLQQPAVGVTCLPSQEADASISWLWLCYFLGVAVFSIQFLRNLLLVFKSIHTQESQIWQGFRLVFDPNPCPRSFFHFIFLSPSAWQSPQRDLILAHESAHARLGHSFDLIIIQILHILLWFNPFIILYRRALKEVHEYQADACVLKQVEAKPYLSMLLEQSFRVCGPNFLSAWGTHLTQRRMFMMLQNPNRLRQLTQNGLAFGLSIFLVAGLNFSKLDDKPENWISPLKDYRVTASFKNMKDPFSKQIKFHNGIDLAAPLGTDVFAPASGTVHLVGEDSSHGIYVQLRHAEGWVTVYNHLSAAADGLKKGDKVKQGQVIGKVGSTGRSTGPHLHYEILKSGKNVDPKPYL